MGGGNLAFVPLPHTCNEVRPLRRRRRRLRSRHIARVDHQNPKNSPRLREKWNIIVVM